MFYTEEFWRRKKLNKKNVSLNRTFFVESTGSASKCLGFVCTDGSRGTVPVMFLCCRCCGTGTLPSWLWRKRRRLPSPNDAFRSCGIAAYFYMFISSDAHFTLGFWVVILLIISYYRYHLLSRYVEN